MVQERGVVSLSSSPAVSQRTRMPWHRWDCVCVHVPLDIFVMADDDETHLGWPVEGTANTQRDQYTLTLAPSHTHTHSQQGALGRVRSALRARHRHVDSIHHISTMAPYGQAQSAAIAPTTQNILGQVKNAKDIPKHQDHQGFYLRIIFSLSASKN